jgi:hypothetical protein
MHERYIRPGKVRFPSYLPKLAAQELLQQRHLSPAAAQTCAACKDHTCWSTSVLFFLLLASNSFGLVPRCSATTGQVHARMLRIGDDEAKQLPEVWLRLSAACAPV